MLKPTVTVATNSRAKMIYPTVKWRVAATGSALFPVVDHNGIMASFQDGGGLVMTENIMSADEAGHSGAETGGNDACNVVISRKKGVRSWKILIFTCYFANHMVNSL